tara:strand:+ start:763 stop:897 length:135 start_codon:yes stop_codon:yes gene_type:complete
MGANKEDFTYLRDYLQQKYFMNEDIIWETLKNEEDEKVQCEKLH